MVEYTYLFSQNIVLIYVQGFYQGLWEIFRLWILQVLEGVAVSCLLYLC